MCMGREETPFKAASSLPIPHLSSKDSYLRSREKGWRLRVAFFVSADRFRPSSSL